MMVVSWKLDIHFRNCVLYVGTWTGDRRFNFGIMLCMLGLDWDWTFYFEVRIRTSMFVLGLGMDIPFGNYFGVMGMCCGSDI